MTPDSITTMVVAAVGMAVSWAVWVSVSIFKHAQEIALLKQGIKLLDEIRDVLDEIKTQMKGRRHG